MKKIAAFLLAFSLAACNFCACDAAEITAETGTGSVTGTLLSGKNFFVSTTTGDVSVPATTGGMCKISTGTGNVKIEIVG